MAEAPKRQLSLFDSTCLIVGIIIGVGIYKTAPDVARSTTWWWGIFALWAAGGLLSLAGALCYAELASAYPRQGGDYVYLSRAYGPWAGFLFGWVQLVVVRPGDIAAMAFAMATYAREIYDPFAAVEGSPRHNIELLYACAAVILLTAINIVGVREGKWTQNLLTTVKTLGLLMIFFVALIAPADAASSPPEESLQAIPLSLAMILVLFAFGGWNEMAYVAAEVKNPKRNIVSALVLGTVAVTVLYLMVNAAFLYALGHARMAASEAVAAEAVSTAFPRFGGRIISALICISALGVINGLVFTGARISYAVGADHRAFRVLGQWDPRRGTPVRALLVQAALAVAIILLLGSFLDTLLYTAAAVYCFYLATSLALVVLRRKEPEVERPYRVTGYPVTPIVFAAACALLLRSALCYSPWGAAVSSAIILAGLPIYWLTRRR